VTRALNYRRLSLDIRHGTVLFPFDVVEFLRAVSKQGYIVAEDIPSQRYG